MTYPVPSLWQEELHETAPVHRCRHQRGGVAVPIVRAAHVAQVVQAPEKRLKSCRPRYLGIKCKEA